MRVFVLFALALVWALGFAYAAQRYAMPLWGLTPLNFGQYVWFSILMLLAYLPAGIIKALKDS